MLGGKCGAGSYIQTPADIACIANDQNDGPNTMYAKYNTASDFENKRPSSDVRYTYDSLIAKSKLSASDVHFQDQFYHMYLAAV